MTGMGVTFFTSTQTYGMGVNGFYKLVGANWEKITDMGSITSGVESNVTFNPYAVGDQVAILATQAASVPAVGAPVISNVFTY
jgi:hypothetical protein